MMLSLSAFICEICGFLEKIEDFVGHFGAFLGVLQFFLTLFKRIKRSQPIYCVFFGFIAWCWPMRNIWMLDS